MCAPFFVTTLCRYEHFKRCIESLLNNSLANQTHVFIALDYPSKETHEDGYRKIVDYIDTVTGFKDITVFKRTSNLGAVKNAEEGVDEVLKHYDRIIFSEDDNEFSPDFLEYINKGLDLFEKHQNIFAVCGYCYPVDLAGKTKSNHFFWKGISAWGYGIWRDRYYQKKFNRDEIFNYVASYKYLRKQNCYAPVFYRTLVGALDYAHPLMDAYISMKLLADDQYCVFPVLSKVRNLGHDGTGVHCFSLDVGNIYANQVIDTEKSFDYDSEMIKENRSVNKVLRRFFSIAFKTNVRNHLLCLAYFVKKVLK